MLDLNIFSLGSTPVVPSSFINGKSTGETSQGNQSTASFKDVLAEKLEEANSLQKQADRLTETFMAGGEADIHEMLIAMEKADMALRETVEIRNKLVEAYKEIEKMQI